MIVVADAGPLIHLCRIGQLDLLRRLYDSVLVPEAVYDEVVKAGAGRAGSDELFAASWCSRDKPPASAIAELEMALPQLGKGEISAIAVAIAQHAGLILMDDLAARRAAQQRALTVKGTLGILLDAKSHGHLRLVAPALQELLRSGMWLDPALVREVLRLAKEISNH